jgi:hypothetical protein
MLKFLLFLLCFKQSESLTLNCLCGNANYYSILQDNVYGCQITHLNLTKTEEFVTKIMRKHDIKKTNADVELLSIHNQTVHEIPGKIGNFFANVDGFEVINSDLKVITKKNLMQFKHLKYLNLMKNQIEVLANDLFEHNLKLKIVIICCNRLKIIGNNIFDSLNHLNHVDFRRNVCVHKRSEDHDELKSLMKEIDKKCPPSIEVYCTFADQDFPAGNFYTCEVRFWIIVINYMTIENFEGRHDSGRKNYDVHGLRVHEMTTAYMPINLCLHFPRLEAIEVVGGRMTKLEKKDLRAFPHLKVLWLPRNNVKTLSNDVFEANPKLEKISFYYNMLKVIGSEVFKSLKFLKFVSLEYNDCIHKAAGTKICLRSMQKEIKKSCQIYEIEED